MKDNHGRIGVLANVKPREEEIEEVMREANGVIEKGLPVLREILPRDDAERIYGKDVYDYFPVPSEVRELIVIKIPNWNVNACSRDHTANTREVGQVLLDYWRYKQAKGLLEVAFNLARSE
ncbi:alanyl-tRNA editing protein [Metallosphaera hakonensis]|uniref:alanyl-tRNA editing protein n=1 Tax=Metallosphaera hakonensis TaxID=79601 RepID=UPI000B197C9D|nr:alanyl-tRNA editing protein [Metallosphaera hakonensis]